MKLTLRSSSCSLKSVAAKVMVAAQDMLAASSSVTRLFTASEWTSSFCEKVVTVPHPNFRMKAMRAGLCEESGATVL